MKLRAKTRLKAESGPSNTSVKGFVLKMAHMAGGQIPLRNENSDCRATVVRDILKPDSKSDAIVIVGDDGHPIHTFTVDTNGHKITDSFASGSYSHGAYRCTLSNGEAVELKTLAVINVDDFKAQHVEPLALHGHVVPLADGRRAKCGGPSSPLACTVCAREANLLAAGLHPLKSNSKD